MSTDKKIIIELLDQIKDIDNQPFFSKEYIEKTFLGIKPAKYVNQKISTKKIYAHNVKEIINLIKY